MSGKNEDFIIKEEVVEWLLEGDPAVQWQTAQDLIAADKDDIHEYRFHIELEGWGREILDIIEEDSSWSEGTIYPYWTSKFWVLYQLQQLGIYPLEQLTDVARHILDLIEFDGGIMDPKSEETHSCLSGLALGILSYYKVTDKKREALLEYILEHQKDNGSWQCTEDEDPFVTTFAVLIGLRDHLEVDLKNSSIIKDMRREAHEFLLSHELFKDRENKAILDLEYFRFPFPFMRYDLLSILDYFRSINFKYDARLEDAVEVIASKGIDFKWLITSNNHDTIIQMEDHGKESRWNTLRALRVLSWWYKRSKDGIKIIETEEN